MTRIHSLTSTLFFIALLAIVPQQAFSNEKEQIAGDRVEYRVVINHEEQYSIWLADREIPKGWKATGFIGSKEAALRNIEEVWTDMRPISERRRIALEIYRKYKKGK